MKSILLFCILSVLFILPVSSQGQALQFDANVSAALRAQVQGDFQFIQTIKAEKTSPFHEEIFGKARIICSGLTPAYFNSEWIPVVATQRSLVKNPSSNIKSS